MLFFMVNDKHMTRSVRDEMFERILIEDDLKNRKQGIFGLFFLSKADQFKPKSKGWIHLCF